MRRMAFVLCYFVLGVLTTVQAEGPEVSARWHAETTDWTRKLEIGDWGIDRPGYPKGLYIEGVTVKEGRKVKNPVIYDNDVYDDVIDDEWMFVMASLGQLNLVGQVLTPVYAESWKFYWGDEWIATAREAMDRAREAGLDMRRIPEFKVGTEAPTEKEGERKDSEGARLYVELINKYYRKNPKLPVLINVGGQAATLASAYCIDPSIAEKCIVYYTDMGDYNGDYRWASELIARHFRVVNFGRPGAWWRSKLYQNEWNVFPRPEYREAWDNDENSGEWHLLSQTGNPLLVYMVNGFFRGRKEICCSGWKADGYCDGTFMHAWIPSMFPSAKLCDVRRGAVLQVTEFGPDQEALVKQQSMEVLLDPRAYGKKCWKCNSTR